MEGDRSRALGGNGFALVGDKIWRFLEAEVENINRMVDIGGREMALD